MDGAKAKMKPIRSVAILGAGAMGAAYAAMFSEAADFDVCFVADGERVERLKRGLTVNGRPYQVKVLGPGDAAGPADLILVALKHHHLREALPQIETLVGEDTTILSVMNGLESEEIIGAIYGMDKMVLAIALGIDAVRGLDGFRYSQPGKIIFGATPQTGAGRTRRLGEALTRAGIPNEVPDDIRRAVWWKFMINVGINQASAVLQAPYEVFQSSTDARALMRMLMAEVTTLAERTGIDLGTKDMDAWDQVLSGLAPKGKTSMLQDIESGRKTEVEIFAGKMSDLGEQYHVPTPVNDAVLRIIKVMESRMQRG
jgi:2-dehydropantoate 2-reductase